MSLFDPYHINKRRVRKSHKGQVIQQRISKDYYAISPDELPRSIKVLKSYGYTISPPGQDPEPVQTIFKDGLSLPLTINFNTGSSMQYTVKFNDILTVIGNRLDSILVYENNVVDSLVEFYITSIEYYVNTNVNSVGVNLYTNKINWNNTINKSTGVLAVPLNSTQFRYISYQPGSWGNQFSQSFSNTDVNTSLAYYSSNDTSIYQQICQNHAVNDDFTVAQITTASGYITIFNLNIIMSITVNYLDEAEPVN